MSRTPISRGHKALVVGSIMLPIIGMVGSKIARRRPASQTVEPAREHLWASTPEKRVFQWYEIAYFVLAGVMAVLFFTTLVSAGLNPSQWSDKEQSLLLWPALGSVTAVIAALLPSSSRDGY